MDFGLRILSITASAVRGMIYDDPESTYNFEVSLVPDSFDPKRVKLLDRDKLRGKEGLAQNFLKYLNRPSIVQQMIIQGVSS
jgi:hypothetical protein